MRRLMTMKRVSTLLGVCLLLAGVTAAGEKGTEAEAKALLDKAVVLVEKEGEAKALAAFNDPKGGFVDRDLYVFCMDAGGKITAHISSDMRGTDVATLKDPDGKPIGKEMIRLTRQGGGTVEYRWMNPVSKKVENKVSFLKKAGSQYCGVGIYK
jgi:signal transduction histidine kinase